MFLSARYKASTISKLLKEEGIKASRRGILALSNGWNYSASTRQWKNIVNHRRNQRDSRAADAVQLHKLLNKKGYPISLRTVLRCSVSLGWTFRGSSYCQLRRNSTEVSGREIQQSRTSALFRLNLIAASVAMAKVGFNTQREVCKYCCTKIN